MNRLVATADTELDYIPQSTGTSTLPPTGAANWHHEVMIAPTPISMEEMISSRLIRDEWVPSETLEKVARLFKLVSGHVVSTVPHADEYDDSWLVTAQTRFSPRPAWQPQIETASTHEEIVAVLRLFGLVKIADRLSYLRSLADDDPDEPTIDIESLQAMALFLMDERQLPDPQIGASPDGFILIEWPVPTNGILAMEFLPSGLIRFAATSGPTQPGTHRKNVSGTYLKDEVLAAVQPFSSQLEAQ